MERVGSKLLLRTLPPTSGIPANREGNQQNRPVVFKVDEVENENLKPKLLSSFMTKNVVKSAALQTNQKPKTPEVKDVVLFEDDCLEVKVKVLKPLKVVDGLYKLKFLTVFRNKNGTTMQKLYPRFSGAKSKVILNKIFLS